MKRASRTVRIGLGLLLIGTFSLMLWHGFAEPHAGRFWDERFSFANAQVVLSGNLMSYGPANAYYPSLSYLPQAAAFWIFEQVSQWTGIEGLSVYDPEVTDGWSATAYRVARGVSALFGVLAVFWAYRVGRRVFGDPRAAWLGAAFFAATPALIQASALFKPDALVAWLTLVIFLWSVDAVQKPTVWRYLQVGVGIGLATAAKYTGAGACIPLVVGTLLSAPKSARRWLWLVAAGVVSILTFVMLNPFLGDIFAYIPRLFEISEGKAEMERASHWTALAHQARFLWRHHGPVVLGLAVVGLVGLARRTRKSVEAGMVLGFVLGYSLLYAALVTSFRGQNYIPVSAFTAVAAGWIAVSLWDRLVASVPSLDRRIVGVSSAALVVVVVFVHPVLWVYDQVTPTTWERAARILVAEFRPVEQRHFVWEKREDRLQATFRGGRMASTAVTHLGEVSDEELARADALVFLADALDGPDADFYLSLLAEARGTVRRLEPAPFHLQGTPLVLVLRDWRLVEEPTEMTLTRTGERTFTIPAPDPAAPGELWSLRVRIPRQSGRRRPATVRVGDEELPLRVTRISGRRGHFSTPRFEPPEISPEAETLKLQFERDPGDLFQPKAWLLRWEMP